MKSSKNSSGRRLYDRKKPVQKSSNQSANKPSEKRLKSAAEDKPKRKIELTRKSSTRLVDDRKQPIRGGKFSKPEMQTSRTKTKNITKVIDKDIRLNKYISNSGVCSRREADNFIKSGNVSVNGKVITEMGYKVQVTDVVKFDGTTLNPEVKRYVLLNKPKGYITTMDDEKDRKIVTELVRTACKERIYPVGRLDRNTTGLLLFTNDGEMAKKLTHPKSNVSKLYHVTLDKNLKLADFHKIADGFRMDDFDVIVDEISYIEGASKNEVGVRIHSGRNRIIRRIFEHFEYNVIKLDRVIFAGLTKKNLPRGIWRHLTEQEIINLKML